MLGNLLVTPSLHGAIQKAIELFGILKVSELPHLDDNKPEESVKKILGTWLIL
jgi:hypothetical protein